VAASLACGLTFGGKHVAGARKLLLPPTTLWRAERPVLLARSINRWNPTMKSTNTPHVHRVFGVSAAVACFVILVVGVAGGTISTPLPACDTASPTALGVAFASPSDLKGATLRVLVQGPGAESVDSAGERSFYSSEDLDQLAAAATLDRPTLVLVDSPESRALFEQRLGSTGSKVGDIRVEMMEAARLDAIVGNILRLKDVRIEPTAGSAGLGVCTMSVDGWDTPWELRAADGNVIETTSPEDDLQWQTSERDWRLTTKFGAAELDIVLTPTGSAGTAGTSGSNAVDTTLDSGVTLVPDTPSSAQSQPTEITETPSTAIQPDELVDGADVGRRADTESTDQAKAGDGIPTWALIVPAIGIGLLVGVGLGFVFARRGQTGRVARIAESPIAHPADGPGPFVPEPIEVAGPLDMGDASIVVQVAPDSVGGQVAASASERVDEGALSGTATLGAWLNAEWGWSEKISGRGEDAMPVVISSGGGETFIAVADGLGGAGAAEVGRQPNGQPITSAQVGSNAVMEAIAGFARRGVPIEQMTPAAIQNAIRAKFDEKRSIYQEASFGGSLVRQFPTTFASAAILRSSDGGVDLRVMWAGDSRAFILYPNEGLSALTRDHVDSNADDFELTQIDPKMNNVIEDRSDFHIDIVHHRIERPCYVVVATDGVFGYLPTPRFFEYSILLSRLRRVVDGSPARPRTSGLIRTIRAYAKDDASYVLLAVGPRAPDDEQALILPHIKRLQREMYVPGGYATNPSGDPEFNRRDWMEYKTVYERYVRAPGAS
jgi:serine/threonine protein phosphatase PrpC